MGEWQAMTRQSLFFFALAGLVITSCLQECASPPFEITLEHDASMKTRDGVVLRADIYRPKAEGKFPVLLNRTPYDKREYVSFALKAAARGYVVIVQDTRGRHASDGEWYPFKDESRDGYDTVEWAAALPFANGKVGMFGRSYDAATQMLAAIASPPHLSGIFPYATGSNYHEGWVYQGGAFEQSFNESWTSMLAQDALDRRVQSGNMVRQWLWKLPLWDYVPLDLGPYQGLAPYFIDWVKHPTYDEYWKQWSVAEHLSNITVPVYHIGAWYDLFLGGTLQNYTGIKTHGGSEAARRGQRLWMIIGGHAGHGRKIGEVDFGPAAEEIDVDEVLFRWYDHLLKGIENGFDKAKPVTIFVMGKNIWREEDDWPLARAQNTQFYLHSQGRANSNQGNGVLSRVAPFAEPPDRLVYDPADPVPTTGGPACCARYQILGGARDQRSVEARTDVLVYSLPQFKEDFEVTGPVRLELYASSSAVDTDFTAKLVDVWPNGFAQNLTDGILRARYRNSAEKPEFLTPGEIYKFTLDLWSTSNVFLKGHTLRLEISSSNFPRFDRNLNTGENYGEATKWVKATNDVYHDRDHPSALILPVVPQ